MRKPAGAVYWEVMIKVLVVDEQEERRASVVDALCELPGIEVCATASDARRGLALLEAKRPDAVVAASDLTGASIVTLIDDIRRRGLADIIVSVPAPVVLPRIREYWKDLGARAVVETIGELIASVRLVADHRRSMVDRKRQLAYRLETAAVGGGPSPQVTHTSAAVKLSPPDQRAARGSSPIAVADVLRNVLPRLKRLVHDEIELVLEAAADLPPVRCTVADIERIALHLVHDAARAIPLGGKIWLFVERDGQRHLRIEVLDSSGTSRAAGPGVDSARVIVERYAGELRVSDLGNSTSLQVVLPAIVEAAN